MLLLVPWVEREDGTWQESTLSLPIYPTGSRSVLMAEKSTEHSWALLFTWPSVKSYQGTLSALTLASQATLPESGEPTRLGRAGPWGGGGDGLPAPSGRRHPSPGRLAVAATSATDRVEPPGVSGAPSRLRRPWAAGVESGAEPGLGGVVAAGSGKVPS